MARKARTTHPGIPVHVTQRGNNKSQVFHDDNDRHCFMHLFAKFARRHRVEIHSYCLMDNHYHVACTPPKDDSLSKLFGQLNGVYAMYYNSKYGTSGHVWQDRFRSCFLLGMHLTRAMRYIERNPVKASLVKKATDWPWSTARATCGKVPVPTWLSLPKRWSNTFSPSDWQNYLDQKSDDDITDDQKKLFSPVHKKRYRKTS